MSTNNYARPHRTRSHAVERPAPVHAYVFFADSAGPPAEVLANPAAWDLHHLPAGFASALSGANVVGVGPELVAESEVA